MKKQIFIVSMVIFTIATSATITEAATKGIKVINDEFSGATVYETELKSPVNEKAYKKKNVHFKRQKKKKRLSAAGFKVNFKKTVDGTGKPAYTANIRHRFEIDDLEFKKEGALQFSVDGKFYSFDRVGEVATERGVFGILKEAKVDYVTVEQIPENVMIEMANAERVKVRIVGHDQTKSGHFRDRDLKIIQELVKLSPNNS